MCFAEDCNSNGIEDSIDISTNGLSIDCNTNSIPDECEIESGIYQDCNSNGLIDNCDINWCVSSDSNMNGIPDECDPVPFYDCDQDGVSDILEMQQGGDCNNNNILDTCEILLELCEDANTNGIPDSCESYGPGVDCNENGIPDSQDIANGTSQDCDSNYVPDECQGDNPLHIVFLLSSQQFDSIGQNLVCSAIDEALVALESAGLEIRSTKLGILNEFQTANCNFHISVMGLLGPRINNFAQFNCYTITDDNPPVSTLDDESWGTAVAIVSSYFEWRTGHGRIIVPITDEAACGGGGYQVDDPDCELSDAAAVQDAIDYANANGVVVNPIFGNLGNNVNGCVMSEVRQLANSTKGVVIHSYANDTYETVAQKIKTAILNTHRILNFYDCDGNGILDKCDISTNPSADEDGDMILDQCEVRYVDDDAATGGDGLTWATAYCDLEDALEDTFSQPWVNEIRVAEGTYHPDCREDLCDEWNPEDNRQLFTFRLRSNLTLLGGYKGGSTNPDDRNVELYPTLLSGDFDDGNNAWHVVTADYLQNCVLDGFLIHHGNGSEYWNNSHVAWGGGLTATESSLVVRNCEFRQNLTGYGSGAWQSGGDLLFENCHFHLNYTGGGIHAKNAQLEVRQSEFDDNEGCALYAKNSEVKVTNSKFYDNIGTLGGSGGAIGVTETGLNVDSCIFNRNFSNDKGGGISVWQSNVNVAHSLFVGNRAYDIYCSQGDYGWGGGLSCFFSSGVIHNCILIGNSSVWGGGISFYTQDQANVLTVSHCTITENFAISRGGGVEGSSHLTTEAELRIYNSILWDNHAYQAGGTDGDQIGSYAPSNLKLYVYYTDIAGPIGGSGRDAIDSYFDNNLVYPDSTEWININLNADPEFYWEPDAGGDGWLDNPETTIDESANDITGDVYLQNSSPCINAGNSSTIPLYSEMDYDSLNRIIDSETDMGAYEHWVCDIWLRGYYHFQRCYFDPTQECLDHFDKEPNNGDGDLDCLDLAVFTDQMDQDCPGILPSVGSSPEPSAMMAMQAETSLESPAVIPWVCDEGSIDVEILPLTGGPPTTTLAPHATYIVIYTADFPATDFTAIVRAPSLSQGIAIAQPANSGKWSVSAFFDFIGLEELTGVLDPLSEDGLTRTQVVVNTIPAPGSSSGELFIFTTGEPGCLQILVELGAVSIEAMESVLSEATIELIVENE